MHTLVPPSFAPSLSPPLSPPSPSPGHRLSQEFPYIEAEVKYAIKEYACTVIDVLARRTRLAFLNVQAAHEALPRIIEIMSAELGWDKNRKKVCWYITLCVELDHPQMALCKPWVIRSFVQKSYITNLGWCTGRAIREQCSSMHMHICISCVALQCIVGKWNCCCVAVSSYYCMQ